MKSSIFSLVAAAALAVAQQGIPTCATPCVAQFTTGSQIAGCQQLDIGCICKNAEFLENIACCLSSACSKADQAQAVQYAKQICSSAGVSTPDQVVCNQKASSSSSSSPSESSTHSESSASSATTGSSDSSTTAADSTTTSSSATSATTGSSATSRSQSSSSSPSSSSSNVAAAPLATAGSFVGAAIAVLAAAL